MLVSPREPSLKDRRGNHPENRCTTSPMGNLRAVLSVALLSLAACGDDGGSAKPDATVIIVDAAVDAAPDTPPLPDAPSYDFSCMGNAAPTTATATVSISGTAQEVTLQGMTPSIMPKNGVMVKACTGNCTGQNLKDTQTTANAGTFATAAITTGGTPINGYLDATVSTAKRTLVFPPSPLIANTPNVPILMFSNAVWQALPLFVGTPDPQKGHAVIAVTDCAMMPIDGATISVKQNGTAVAGTTEFDLGALSAMAAGAHLVLNIPPGDTEVGATYNGMTLRAHVIMSVADSVSETIVRPGY